MSKHHTMNACRNTGRTSRVI